MIQTIDIHITHPMSFERGKSYCVEAASGVGKSSLLHFIGGYRRDYEGQICFDGRDIKTFSPSEWSMLYRTGLAYLFQDLRLFPSLTASENVQLVNQHTAFRSQEEIKALFERLSIADKRDTPVRLLSWGQQQRVAAIRALCQPCSFLLLDEPVSHLDDNNAAVLAALIREEQLKCGFGIIATSVGKPLPIDYDQTIRL